jgi:hypothetical protein
MNRRALINVLIGVAAALSALMAVTALRQRRCEDDGALWENAGRTCRLNGATIDVAGGADLLIGAGVGLAVAFMLFRMSTFALSRRSQPYQR